MDDVWRHREVQEMTIKGQEMSLGSLLKRTWITSCWAKDPIKDCELGRSIISVTGQFVSSHFLG